MRVHARFLKLPTEERPHLKMKCGRFSDKLLSAKEATDYSAAFISFPSFFGTF